MVPKLVLLEDPLYTNQATIPTKINKTFEMKIGSYIEMDELYRWQCKDKLNCLSLYKINNGKEDCQDGSDENHTILNYTNQTSIGNLIWLCDGKLLNISDLCNGRGMSNIVFIEKFGLFVGNNF